MSRSLPVDAPELSTAASSALYSSVVSGRRVDAVARRLAGVIRVGLLEEGARLPGETVLARQLGVAPATLRDSLTLLRKHGLVETRRGRGGGTFVRLPAEPSIADLRARLFSLSLQFIRDLSDHREAIAGAAARLAAQRSLPDNVERLRAHHQQLVNARTPGDRRRADVRFHLEVAATSQSVRLTRAEMDLWAELAELAWLVLSEDRVTEVVQEHRGILWAIERGREELARRRAEEHVRAEMTRLLELRLDRGGRK